MSRSRRIFFPKRFLKKKMNLPNQEEELLDFKDSLDFFATLPKNSNRDESFYIKVAARLETLAAYEQQALNVADSEIVGCLLRKIAKQRDRLNELWRCRVVDNRVFGANAPIDKLVERIL
jgi:hypothetical protein